MTTATTVPLRRSQDPNDVLDWTFDFTDELAANGAPTITDAECLTDNDGAIVSAGATHDDTTVTCVLSCPTVDLGTDVGLTAHATLSSGEQIRKTHTIRIEKT